MKFFSLFLISMLALPCPCYWGDVVCAFGNNQCEVVENLTTESHCCHNCSSSQHAEEEHYEGDENHLPSCPCLCCVEQLVIAQIVTPISLNDYTAVMSLIVEEGDSLTLTHPLINENFDCAFVATMIPLRI